MEKFIKFFAVSFIVLCCFLQITGLAGLTFSVKQEGQKIQKTSPFRIGRNQSFNISCIGLQLISQSIRKTVYWTRNNLSIPELATKWMVINENGELGTINTKLVGFTAEKKHEGEYRCTQDGPAIVVKVAAKHSKIDVSYRGISSVYVGSHWYILCHHGINEPAQWSKNNENLQNLSWNEEVKIKNITNTTSMLISLYARTNHSGNYKCTKFKLDPGFDLFVKKVKYDGPYRNLPEGGGWTISCKAEPGTNFHWTRNDEEIPEFATGEIRVIHRDAAEAFTKIFSPMTYRWHSGIYKCILGDDNGFELTVRAKTDIKIVGGNDINLRLPCNAYRTHHHIDHWLKDGRPFQNIFDARGKRLATFNRSSGHIIVHMQHPNIYGNYVCRPDLYSSTNSSSHTLVVPRPRIAIKQLESTHHTDYTDVACRGNLWPQVTIHWECNRSNYKMLRDATTGIHNGILRIYNLGHGERVNVTCRAWYKPFNRLRAKNTLSIHNP